jgi:hypothetical protein
MYIHKIAILAIISLGCANHGLYAQQLEGVKADSSMASKNVTFITQLFSLSDKQRQQLFRADTIAGKAIRKVFRQKLNKDQFRNQLAKAKRLKDSLYVSVLGEKNFRIYSDTLRLRYQQAVIQQKIRLKQRQDSIKIKNY